jgi:hypothetical protein
MLGRGNCEPLPDVPVQIDSGLDRLSSFLLCWPVPKMDYLISHLCSVHLP